MSKAEVAVELHAASPDGERWRAGTLTSQVVRAVTSVGLLAAVARCAMGGRDIALANRFGTGDAVDAFVVALVIPMFAVQVMSGALPNAFLPVFSKAHAEDPPSARRLLEGTLAWNVTLVGALTALLAATPFLTLHVMGAGFGAHKIALTRSLFFILLPIVLFGALSAIWASVLNASGRFVVAAFTPALAPLGAFAVLVSGPHAWGIRGVAWGTTGGAALEAVFLAVAVKSRGYSVWPRWSGLDADLRAVMRQYAPAAAGALLMSTTFVVDQAVAAAHGSGSVSALNYGGKVVSFATGVGAMAVGTVVLPHISAIAARRDWVGVRRTVRSYATMVAAVAVPITIVVVVLSKPLVELLFQHGAFTAHDTRIVAGVQIAYALQIPSFLVGIVGVRALSALRRNHVLALISMGNVIVNLVADVVFLKLLGLWGIALSTSLVYLCSTCAVFWALRRILENEHRR